MRSLAEEARTNFFLPKNPVAAAYVLSRLSNQELISAPRSEPVYLALLRRAGLERKYRLEALEGLAKLRKTDSLTELLNGLSELDKEGEASASSIADLSPILLQSKPGDLTAKRGTLETLAAQSQLPITRQIAYAGIVTADNSMERTWKETEPEPARLTDLLLALPLVRDSKLVAPAYPRIATLLKQDSNADLRRAAITAISVAPDHDVETFKTLSELLQSGIERTTVIGSLQHIPQKAWPKDGLQPLIDSLLQYLQAVPPGDRTGADFSAAIQFATDLASLLPEEKSRSLTKTLRGLGPAIIVLRAVYEQLRYDKQLIVVEAGKPVALVLDNQDAMPHNLAVVAPGALEEIGTAAEKMGPEPDSEGRLYIPSSSKVLHASKLAAPGQKIQLAFDAPEQPGDYPYVCTFPGHWRRMTGIMAVVKDVDAYLAAHAQSEQPKITEWKLEDLVSDLSNAVVGRNLENGKKLFTQAACAQCHKLGKEGYGYGPELTGVLVRYKGDRASVLQQILEPSKIIEDRYRNVSFDLKGGEPIAGMVLKEDAQSVTIQAGPSDSLIQTLKKSEILERKPQPYSLMPAGLLNNLCKDQIFDLFAYVLSGGDSESHVHKH
jgi:putative heme-binding domain-containing protein